MKSRLGHSHYWRIEAYWIAVLLGVYVLSAKDRPYTGRIVALLACWSRDCTCYQSDLVVRCRPGRLTLLATLRLPYFHFRRIFDWMISALS
jgi:hypothetical protein